MPGLGNIAQLGQHFGVLTCAHAWDLVRRGRPPGNDRAEVGIMGFTTTATGSTRRDFDVEEPSPIVLGREPYKVPGTDLAFIRLPTESEAHNAVRRRRRYRQANDGK